MEKEVDKSSSVKVGESDTSTLDRFRSSLWEAVRSLRIKDGIDFDNLPFEGQLRETMIFLQGFYGRLSQELALSTELSARMNSSKEEKVISRETVDLTVSSVGKERTIRLGQTRKEMLAYFTLLTEKKMERGLVPWITRKELVEHAPYSLDQLDLHLFGPLAELGLFEVTYYKGYRLLAKPRDVWEVLQGEKTSYFLKTETFSSWAKETPFLILVEEYQLPFIEAVYELYWDRSPEEFLDIPAICAKVDRSRDQVYENLKRLEKAGLIKRTSSIARYRVGDVGIENMVTLLQLQKEKVVLKIRFRQTVPESCATSPKAAKIDTLRSEPLDVRGQEEFDFPAISWRQKKVAVERLSFEAKLDVHEDWLRKMYLVLVAELSTISVFDKEKKVAYIGPLPCPENISQETLLAILDFLGFGPEELLKFGDGPTLAAEIRRLENAPRRLEEEIFVAELKARLVTLMFDEVVLPEEGKNYSWVEILADLEGLSPQKKPGEIVLEEEPVLPIEHPVEEEPVKPNEATLVTLSDSNRKLLPLVEKFLEKEILSVLKQPSLFLDPLPPLATYNYHRTLSRKADSVPLESLSGRGLVVYQEGGDYHPRYTPSGALLASLYLNFQIHNRALAVNKGEARAIEAVAVQLAHLLTARFLVKNGGQNQREKTYLKECLKGLRGAGFVCSCPECQNLIFV